MIVARSHSELPETADPDENVVRLAGDRICVRLDDDVAAQVKAGPGAVESVRRQVEGLAGLLRAIAKPIE
jgi:hypothetical protein